MNSFSDYLAAYWHVWLIEAGVVLVLFAFVLVNWKKITKIVMNHMMLSAVTIWLAGMVIYSIGFTFDGSGHTAIAVLFRASLASLEMFVSGNELVEVSQYYKDDPIYMACFATIHVSAVVLSAILILNTVGFRLKHRFFLTLEKMDARSVDKDTYIFWGFSDQSIQLAKDIREKYEDARIIFIRATSDTSLGEKLAVGEFLNSNNEATHTIKVMRSVESINDAIVVYASANNIDTMKFGPLNKIIRRTTNVNLFFLTNDESQNLKLADKFFRCKKLTQVPKRRVTIYTLSTYGGKNRALEEHIVVERQNGNNANWKFIDQSFLTVNALKLVQAYQPVSMIPKASIDNGAVNEEFNALIIGLGRTGIQMYKFLYEFSTFYNTDGQLIKKNFLLVDKNMDHIAGDMCISNPAMLETDDIKMLNLETGTVEFWKSISELMPTINCISIALGDDQKNIELAIDFYRVVMQYATKKPENVKIFIRINDQENEETIKGLADDYNKSSASTGIELVPFGSLSETFKADVIIGSDRLKSARIFNYNVDILRGKNTDCTADEAWARDFNMKKYLDRFRSLPLAIEVITRKITQCHGDAMHIGTILKLAGMSTTDYKDIMAYAEIAKSREPGTFVYTKATPEQQQLFDNLAKQSLARLYASLWLSGYRYADTKTIEAHPVHAARQKYSDLLTTWDNCPENVKLLAYSVVDTSFIIASEN